MFYVVHKHIRMNGKETHSLELSYGHAEKPPFQNMIVVLVNDYKDGIGEEEAIEKFKEAIKIFSDDLRDSLENFDQMKKFNLYYNDPIIDNEEET